MYQSALVASAFFLFTNINADSSEDPQTFTYYAPPTLNFQDIYANNLALLSDDSTMSNMLDDDTFPIKTADFVEFRPHSATTPTVAKQNSTSENSTTTTTTPTTTSTTTEESKIRVLPIAKGTKYQRGVLDLLFPATRVKNFKSVFDTVRRLLSHTF